MRNGVITALALSCLPASITAQARELPFDAGWELSGAGSRVESYLGARALRMRTGRAIRRDVQLQDGTIEFDMAVTPWRSFTYLQFRMTADGEHEEFYFRPHKSFLADAVQYTPIWRGEGQWQLYHGTGHTAPVEWGRGRWIHIRLVVSGRRAAVFVDGAAEPAIVTRLARDPAPGYLALRAFAPDGGAPEGEMVGAFANLTVHPGQVPYDFGPDDGPPPAAARRIMRWQLSPAVAGTRNPAPVVDPARLAGRDSWPVVASEPSGLLVIGRHLDRPRPLGSAIARIVLEADRAVMAPLQLGFSDRATVFLNGVPMFSADERYSEDNPRQEGLIGLWQATAWLGLRAGRNEVLIEVTDGFGGWGLMGELGEVEGVRVVAP